MPAVAALHQLKGERMTQDEKAQFVSELLGPSFELELVQRAEMQATRETKVWAGVELRFVRRSV